MKKAEFHRKIRKSHRWLGCYFGHPISILDNWGLIFQLVEYGRSTWRPPKGSHSSH
jgi:hypothetical protein